ncbi:MAG: sugar-binding domain-containing protein [Acidobacteriaceae bacterium]
MKKTKLSRRAFLGTAAAATIAAQVKFAGAQGTAKAHAAEGWPENGTLIPDVGWRLWVDEKAEWKQDAIYLPEDVTQGSDGVVMGAGKPLPVNAPTGGWGVLGASAGIPVTLPSTVEQHYWGKYGAGDDGKPRSYTPDEYRYAADDPAPQNGAYFGVSWWWREIEIPASMQGKRIFLRIRGARLRAEVYLNQKLVGYSIMEELPFEADLTAAANPGGKNVLAIRITNPFGRLDWIDGMNAQWGAVKLYRSHGFGGLDRGMTISDVRQDEPRFLDAWVLNDNTPYNSIYVCARVQDPHQAECNNSTMWDFMNKLKTDVIDPRTGKIIKSIESHTGVQLVGDALFYHLFLEYPSAQKWDLHDPRLYHLRFTLRTNSGISDTRTVAFGFRKFAPEGLGTNALFRLNGRRMKIYTAISWGYWGLNGMWPTPELAEKEVTQAKKLNLTCLNFHRNLAKEDVLRAHDRLGLLRYMEPGAGQMAIGRPPAGTQAGANSVVMQQPTNPADKFAQRYMFTKCVEMVKAFRSHPSVIEYCLQNEIGADLTNPDTIAILEAMRKEDPSRCIVLNDGFVAPPRKAAQAWFAPWDDKLHRSDVEEWGGWWNQHQGAGDEWYDEFYKGPDDFTYKSPETKAISEFGEMEGCATPDNHSLMLHELANPKGTGIGNQPANTSYDLADHREILAAYDKFLDKWGFRSAFPATEKLWTSLGKKCYDTWQNYLENARISDELDFAAISGWESTAIENHSGIVDNLRNFKSDPTPITATLLPVRPVAKQRAMCTALDQPATFDIFLLNDTSRPVSGTLSFTAVTPYGKLLRLGEFPAPTQTPDVFSYLVKEGFTTPPLSEVGMYRFKLALSSAPLATQTKEIWVAALPCDCTAEPPLTIGISGITPALSKQLSQLGTRFTLHEFTPGTKYDAIVSGGVVTGTATTQNAGETTGQEAPPVRGAPRRPQQPGALAEGILEAVKAGTPLLAIPQTDALSDGVAKQLAATGAFAYNGAVGDLRAPWMGNWYFVRKHPLYEGMPVDQAMGIHYQARGNESNGLLVERAPGGAEVEIVAAYSRDHSRQIGAGTFITRLGAGKIVYQRVPELQPVLQARFLANALKWLTS